MGYILGIIGIIISLVAVFLAFPSYKLAKIHLEAHRKSKGDGVNPDAKEPMAKSDFSWFPIVKNLVFTIFMLTISISLIYSNWKLARLKNQPVNMVSTKPELPSPAKESFLPHSYYSSPDTNFDTRSWFTNLVIVNHNFEPTNSYYTFDSDPTHKADILTQTKISLNSVDPAGYKSTFMILVANANYLVNFQCASRLKQTKSPDWAPPETSIVRGIYEAQYEVNIYTSTMANDEHDFLISLKD
jgi:hypothetical protein